MSKMGNQKCCYNVLLKFHLLYSLTVCMLLALICHSGVPALPVLDVHLSGHFQWPRWGELVSDSSGEGGGGDHTG